MPTVLLYLSSETGKPSRGLSATSPCSWQENLTRKGVAGQNGVVNGLTVAVTVAVLPGPTVLGTSIKPSA